MPNLLRPHGNKLGFLVGKEGKEEGKKERMGEEGKVEELILINLSIYLSLLYLNVMDGVNIIQISSWDNTLQEV